MIDDYFNKPDITGYTYDDDGNQLICRDGWLNLRLKNSERWLKIGRVFEGRQSGKIGYIKTVTYKHLHVKTDSWGINKRVFDKVDAIILHYGKKRLMCETKKVKQEILHFKKSGNELQVFIPQSEWKEV
jgi:hypothetical protein